jgi:hypothetical protein
VEEERTGCLLLAPLPSSAWPHPARCSPPPSARRDDSPKLCSMVCRRLLHGGSISSIGGRLLAAACRPHHIALVDLERRRIRARPRLLDALGEGWRGGRGRSVARRRGTEHRATRLLVRADKGTSQRRAAADGQPSHSRRRLELLAVDATVPGARSSEEGEEGRSSGGGRGCNGGVEERRREVHGGVEEVQRRGVGTVVVAVAAQESLPLIAPRRRGGGAPWCRSGGGGWGREACPSSCSPSSPQGPRLLARADVDPSRRQTGAPHGGGMAGRRRGGDGTRRFRACLVPVTVNAKIILQKNIANLMY